MYLIDGVVMYYCTYLLCIWKPVRANGPVLKIVCHQKCLDVTLTKKLNKEVVIGGAQRPHSSCYNCLWQEDKYFWKSCLTVGLISLLLLALTYKVTSRYLKQAWALNGFKRVACKDNRCLIHLYSSLCCNDCQMNLSVNDELYSLE